MRSELLDFLNFHFVFATSSDTGWHQLNRALVDSFGGANGQFRPGAR